MRWSVAVGVALAVAVAALSATASPPAPSNKGVASSDATSLLTSLALPAGARSSASEPAGDGGRLANPASRPATPNLIDDHGFWVVPGSVQAVLGFVESHPPAGTSKVLSGWSNGPSGSSVMVGYARRAIRGVLSQRSLVVELTQLAGGGTGVRADAEVVWITPRPPDERVPGAVRRLVLSVSKFGKVIQDQLTFTSARKISRVRELINGLPLSQPGAMSCPADFGSLIQLAFYGRGTSAPLAVAQVDPSGCEQVQLTIRGNRQPALTSMGFEGSGRSGGPSLVKQLGRALGVRIRTGIPSPPA